MPWTKLWKTENVVLPRTAMTVALFFLISFKTSLLMKQCAALQALNTHSLLIRVPPQI